MQKERTRREKFLTDGILLTAVALVMRTAGLFSGAFITRTVGAEGIGLYTLVMTVYGFAVTFATSGISLTVTRLVAEAIGEGHPERQKKILRAGVLYALLFSTAATVALIVFSNGIATRALSDERAAVCLRILAPSLIPIALSAVLSGYFVGVRHATRNAVTQIAGQIFDFGLTVFCLLRAKKGDVTEATRILSSVTTLSEYVSLLLVFTTYFLLKKEKPQKTSEAEKERPIFRSVAGSALPLGLSAYVRSALVTVEHVLIPKCLMIYGMTHAEALSGYGVLHGMALTVILYPMATLTSFSGLLVPEFAESTAAGDEKRLVRLSELALSRTLGYAAAAAVFIGCFSGEIGRIVYHSAEAGGLIAVLAPVIPIMYLDHVTDSMLKGIGEQVFSMWINVSDAALSILLVCLLIPRIGLIGYAFVIIGMEGYNFLLSLGRLSKKIPLSFSFVTTAVVPALLAVCSSVATRAIFGTATNDAGLPALIGRAVFALATFFAASLALRLIRKKKAKKKALV